MKKLLTLVIAAAMALPAAAQGTRLGVEGGINISTLTGMHNSGFRSAPYAAGHIGFVSEFQMTEYFGIRTGIAFSSQGVTSTFINRDIELLIGNYFTVPLIFSAYMMGDRLLVGVGPQLGIAAGMKERYMITAGKFSDWDTIKFKPGDDYYVCDFSLDLVARYLFNDNLGIKLQYNFGLTDVLKPIHDHGGTMIRGRNCNFVGQIGIVYMFDEF